MEIRRVRPDEWEALRDLRLRALECDPDAFGNTLEAAAAYTDEEWRARADQPGRATFVAVTDDGSLVGMANGGPAPDRPDAAGVFGMWVAPDVRGQGLGAALLDAVEVWARSEGYAVIGLGVTTTNQPAVGLYTKNGYVDVGERHPLRDGTDLTIQIMGKSL